MASNRSHRYIWSGFLLFARFVDCLTFCFALQHAAGAVTHPLVSHPVEMKCLPTQLSAQTQRERTTKKDVRARSGGQLMQSHRSLCLQCLSPSPLARHHMQPGGTRGLNSNSAAAALHRRGNAHAAIHTADIPAQCGAAPIRQDAIHDVMDALRGPLMEHRKGNNWPVGHT